VYPSLARWSRSRLRVWTGHSAQVHVPYFQRRHSAPLPRMLRTGIALADETVNRPLGIEMCDAMRSMVCQKNAAGIAVRYAPVFLLARLQPRRKTLRLHRKLPANSRQMRSMRENSSVSC
jgi:hypothetical protein